MLAVGIHGQYVGEPLRGGLLQPVQHCRALALVAGQHKHAQARVGRRLLLQPLGAAVGAAIHHHPYRRPVAPRLAHSVANLGPRVIAGNQDEMSGGRLSHAKVNLRVNLKVNLKTVKNKNRGVRGNHVDPAAQTWCTAAQPALPGGSGAISGHDSSAS